MISPQHHNVIHTAEVPEVPPTYSVALSCLLGLAGDRVVWLLVFRFYLAELMKRSGRGLSHTLSIQAPVPQFGQSYVRTSRSDTA